MTIVMTLLISFMRTIVPSIVGTIIGFLTASGLAVDPELEAALTAVLSAAFIGLYYLVVRLIELKLPWVGVLIGWAKSPDSYSKGLEEKPVEPMTVNNISIDVGKAMTGTLQPDGTILVDGSISQDRIPGPDHRATE